MLRHPQDVILQPPDDVGRGRPEDIGKSLPSALHKGPYEDMSDFVERVHFCVAVDGVVVEGLSSWLLGWWTLEL